MSWQIPRILFSGFALGAVIYLVWLFPWGNTVTELQGLGAVGSAAVGLASIRRTFGLLLPGAAGVAMMLGFGVLWTYQASSDETGLFLVGLALFAIPSVVAGAAGDLAVAELVRRAPSNKASVAAGRSSRPREDEEPMTRQIPAILGSSFALGAVIYLVWVFPSDPTIAELPGVGAIVSAVVGLALIRRKFGLSLPGAAGIAMALGFAVLCEASSDGTGLFLIDLALFAIPIAAAGATSDLAVAKLLSRTTRSNGQ